MHKDQLATNQRFRRLLGAGGAVALVLLGIVELSGRNAHTRDLDGPHRYGDTAGEYRVGVGDEISLRDRTRVKELKVKAYFPQAPGPFPVIIFSHGALGSDNGYEPLARHYASHGYVVVLPTHADSLSLARPGERLGREALQNRLRACIEDPEAWKNRPADISFVIDSLSDIENRVPGLRGRIDTSRIGVGGHSYGAFTAMAAGGATIDVPNGSSALSLADSRVRAVLALSPPGAGQMGLTRDSWNNLSVPMMTVTGSRDRGYGGQPASWRREPFDNSPTGDKYNVSIKDATHGLGGISGADTSLPETSNEEHVKIVRMATTAFWDAYLKGDTRGEAYLQSNQLETSSRQHARIERK